MRYSLTSLRFPQHIVGGGLIPRGLVMTWGEAIDNLKARSDAAVTGNRDEGVMVVEGKGVVL